MWNQSSDEAAGLTADLAIAKVVVTEESWMSCSSCQIELLAHQHLPSILTCGWGCGLHKGHMTTDHVIGHVGSNSKYIYADYNTCPVL